MPSAIGPWRSDQVPKRFLRPNSLSVPLMNSSSKFSSDCSFGEFDSNHAGSTAALTVLAMSCFSGVPVVTSSSVATAAELQQFSSSDRSIIAGSSLGCEWRKWRVTRRVPPRTKSECGTTRLQKRTQFRQFDTVFRNRPASGGYDREATVEKRWTDRHTWMQAFSIIGVFRTGTAPRRALRRR